MKTRNIAIAAVLAVFVSSGIAYGQAVVPGTNSDAPEKNAPAIPAGEKADTVEATVYTGLVGSGEFVGKNVLNL